MALQLKIILLGSNPSIWRKILVPASFTFEKLHLAIQVSMGWSNQHLYAFHHPENKEIQVGQIFEDDDMWPEKEIEDARYVPVLKYFTSENKRMIYLYDFGDSWEHQVILEKTTDDLLLYPICIDGQMACPPEDCGGIPGYYHMLEILERPPRNADRKYYESWLGLKKGYKWDIEQFDTDIANQQLQDLFREVNSLGETGTND